MADTKISELATLTSVASVDLFAIVDDPSGSPISKSLRADVLKDFMETGLTMSGAIGLADNRLSRGKFEDYSVSHQVETSSSGVLTIDYTIGQSVLHTLTENITSVVISDPPPTGSYGELTLRIVQDATARTVTWGSQYLFPNGVDHVMSTGSGDIDIVHMSTTDAGTTWFCTFVQNMS